MEIGIIHQGKLYQLVKTTREALHDWQQNHSFDIKETDLTVKDLELIASVDGTIFREDECKLLLCDNRWELSYQSKEEFKCFWLEGEGEIRRYEAPAQADFACFLSLVGDLEKFSSAERSSESRVGTYGTRQDNKIHLYRKK